MADNLIASSTAVTNLIRGTQEGKLTWVTVSSEPSTEAWSTEDGDSSVILTTGSVIVSAESKPSSDHIAVFAGMDEKSTVVIDNHKTHVKKKIGYFPAVKDLIFVVRKST